MTASSPLSLSPLGTRPLVSILMASWNYAQYIAAAIESALRQAYENFELIVVDDGSTDDSCRIVQGFVERDPRVRLFRKANGGAGSALNRAFAESKGEIVSLLDADDLWSTDKLQKVVQAFCNDLEAGMVNHPLEIIDGEGRRTGEFQCVEGRFIGDDIASLRMGHLMPVASGLSFRRDVLQHIMPLPGERFRSAADLALAYGAAVLAPTVRLPELLASYRVHGSNLSGTTRTTANLDAEFLRKMVSGVERPIQFVDEISRAHRGVSIPTSRSRNVLEHRLLLGLFTGDRALVEETRSHLQRAYREVRRDYPALRYAFLMALSFLPSPWAGPVLRGALRAARARSRLCRRRE